MSMGSQAEDAPLQIAPGRSIASPTPPALVPFRSKTVHPLSPPVRLLLPQSATYDCSNHYTRPVHSHRNPSASDLEQISAKLQAEIMYNITETGGHLRSSLGFLVLVVTLHHLLCAREEEGEAMVGQPPQAPSLCRLGERVCESSAGPSCYAPDCCEPGHPAASMLVGIDSLATGCDPILITDQQHI